MNPKSHSFSRISTFSESCERRHAYDALKGWSSSLPMERGSQIHKALEHLAEQMSFGQTLQAAVEHVLMDLPAGPLSEAQLADYVHRAVPFFEHVTPEKGGVEQWFEYIKGLPLVGKIDLISSTTPILDSYGRPVGSSNTRCVLDHKTIGRSDKIKTESEAKRSLQLKIYSMATGAMNAGFVYYLPYGDVRATIVTFEERDLEFARIWLRRTIDVIESRWKEAHELGQTAPDFNGYNLSPFSLAEHGHFLCSAKYCDHWLDCLGKDIDG